MGSAKNIGITRGPTQRRMGLGSFKFKQTFSIDDYGETGHEIENKGKALCMSAAICFEALENENIKTHYKGLVDKNGNVIKLEKATEPLDSMEFSLARVLDPKFSDNYYDYSIFKNEKTNFLLPLEIIYRNILPEGSSIFRRLEEGKIMPEDIGLDHYPKPGEILKKPLFDVSTKLEKQTGDRYLTWKEAQEIAGLTREEIEEIYSILSEVNGVVTKIAERADCVNEDGKIELIFDEKRNILVADVVGTLDESRMTYKGYPLPKQILRDWAPTYWRKAVKDCKEEAVKKGMEDWHSIFTLGPPEYSEELLALVADEYMAYTNETSKIKFFDCPRLYECINHYKDLLDAIE